MRVHFTWAYTLRRVGMAFSTVNIASTAAIIPVDTRFIPKVLLLPTASTNAGRYLLFKDYYGTSSNSTFTISTTGTDLLDDVNIRYSFSNAFGSMSFMSDGLRSWRTLDLYNGLYTPAAPSTFSPTQITGLQFWYDGTDINGNGTVPSNGASIATWTDKSGNNRNASQNTAATYSNSGLVFTGSQSYNAANTSNLLSNVFFAVFVVEKVNTGGFLFGDITSGRTGGSLHVGYRSLTNVTMAFWNADLEITSISGSGSTRLWSFVLPSTGNRYVNLNGSLVGTFTNNTRLNAFTQLQLGAIFNSSFYNGTLYELDGYTGALTTLQIQQVEGYLAWKWGLQGNLPASHPYKNAPP